MSDRRNSVLTPRRAVAAFVIVLFFAFVASWTSLPARAGSSVATQSTAPQPLRFSAARIAIVDPMKLPPAAMVPARHFMPLRVADPVAYLERKAAMSTGAMLPDVPSLATLPLTTMPAFTTNFAGVAFPDSQCGPGCEPPDTQV